MKRKANEGLSVICMRVVVICRCFFYSINKPSQPQLAFLSLFIPELSRFLVVSRETEKKTRRKDKERNKRERERENACNVMMYAAAVCVMYYVCMWFHRKMD